MKEQKLVEMVRRLHGLVDNTDIEKKRNSQEHLGVFLSSTKEICYEEFQIEYMQAEWVKVNRPHMQQKIVLYCHGGGYCTGGRKYARTVTSKLAMATSMDIMVFDYRLAPENVYPAPLEDVLKAWDYLMLLGYGAKDIIVAGDSAGGNLALTLILQLIERKRMLPGGLLLFSPWTDMAFSGESFKNRQKQDPVLTQEYMYQIREAYVTDKDYMNPYISPIYGTMKGFPPTYIQVGENEILHSDAVRLYQKMLEEGVAVSLDEFEGMWHVFQMSPIKNAKSAIAKCAEFIFEICK